MEHDIDPVLLEALAPLDALVPRIAGFEFSWKIYRSKRGWEAEVQAGQKVGAYPRWNAHAQTAEEALTRAVFYAAMHWEKSAPVRLGIAM